MYAIVREGEGKFYTSMVFGFYSNPEDAYDRYWIVLNREKTALVRKNLFQENTKYLYLMVLITDADESGWRKLDAHRESLDFLPTETLPELIDRGAVSKELIQRCLELDRAYLYEEVRQVRTAEDIRDLSWVSGGFHDGFVQKLEQREDELYILFDGLWGCSLEVWFEGDVAYDVSACTEGNRDPYWYDSKVLFHEGFVYLIDNEKAVAGQWDGQCWFRGRNMRYRVIPD